MIGSPLTVGQALDKFLLPALRLDELFNELSKSPEYTSYLKVVGIDDPAGDTVYHTYTEPLASMPEWQGPRAQVTVNGQVWQSSVRTFASSMKVNVDDIKADAGSPAKLALYRQAAERLLEQAMLLWPSLVVQAIKDGAALSYTGAAAKKWQPDGQNIFDNHPLAPSNASLGYFRNYRSKDTTGGGAAYPISYANELAILTAGRQFKAPNGLDMPIRYNKVVCSPGNGPLLSRLLKDDRIPSWEASGQTAGSTNQGGDVPNAIRRYFEGETIEVVEMANMPSNLRLYVDTTRQTEIPLRLKERQPITWQYMGMSGAEGAFPVGNDEGAVSESVFRSNTAEYGPKARGESYAGNWWRMLLADSTP